MIPGSANPLLLRSGSTQYQVSRSLRFSSADSAYLSRTPGTAGNRKTWTWSGWVKRGKLGATGYIFDFRSTASNNPHIGLTFNGSDQLNCDYYDGANYGLNTTAVFRDPSAWYHIVFVVDTTQAVSTDRAKVYVNGQQITSFASYSWTAQNTDTPANATERHVIGAYNTLSSFFDGYLAEIHFIDGQALTPSSFGETDSVTGEWIPKAYSGGTYGTNGFKLNFSNNSAATAAALGADSSGNGNNWTPNNLSVTAGAGNDSLVDSPTSYGTDTGVGGEVRGNYCTWNPLDKSTNVTLANGNLDWSGSSAGNVRGTHALTGGKFYFECVAYNSFIFGFAVATLSASLSANFASGAPSGVWGWSIDDNSNTFFFYSNGSNPFSVSRTTGAGDVYQLAVDAANPASVKLWVGINNTWYDSTGGTTGNPATGSNPTVTITSGADLFPICGCSNSSNSVATNFGQRPFAYTAPSGFKALCDTSLPTPTIVRPSTVMDVVTYTGNDTTQSLTTNFSPDMVWIKSRSNNQSHQLFDNVRGAGNSLIPNLTNAEATNSAYGYLSAFNSNGFTVAAGGTGADFVNKSTWTYVAWAWDAGSSSTVTNTSGTISSQVRANASAGFSVVTYTGTGSRGTVGHGLGVAPKLIIIKARNSAVDWLVYTTLVDGSLDTLLLNKTDAKSDSVGDALPTSTVFDQGAGPLNGANGINYVAYCFAPVAGYSAFGSYTGTNSAEGPFQWCGFRPKLILVKRTDAAQDWFLFDSARNTYNLVEAALFPNLSNAESTGNNIIDFLSNGFKIRFSGTSGINQAGTYVWAAFAEFPFQYARAR